MEQNTYSYSENFYSVLSKHCSQKFIEANLHSLKEIKGNTDLLTITTDYFNRDDNVGVINKVKFCVAWLQAVSLKNDLNYLSKSKININGKDFNSMQHTDFTSYLQKIGIITQEEQNRINKEWLDITDGEPYYNLV